MKTISISNKKIGNNCPVFIIAEAGVNHNGDINIAKKMIDVAVNAGVDAIKFQTFKTEKLIIKNTPKAEYQIDSAKPEENFFDMLKKLELSYGQFRELKDYCELRNIIFLSTPFDSSSANFLDEIGIAAFKVSSGDFDNFFLLKYLIGKNKPILISSGMSSMEEVRETIQFFKDQKFNNLVLFQCTSAYPTPFDSVNLRVIETYIKEFSDIIIGFSDHSLGTIMGSVAVGLGARVIEKHFTLDQKMEGPDHKASLNPDQLVQYVKNIRNT